MVNLTPRHFYIKTTADESEDAFSGITVPLDVERSEETKKAVTAYSRKQYATSKKVVEQQMEQLFNPPMPAKKQPRKELPTNKSPAKKPNDGKDDKGKNGKSGKLHGA